MVNRSPKRAAPVRKGPMLVILLLGTGTLLLGGCLTAIIVAAYWFDFGGIFDNANKDGRVAVDAIKDKSQPVDAGKLPLADQAKKHETPDGKTEKSSSDAAKKDQKREPKTASDSANKDKSDAKDKAKEPPIEVPVITSTGEFGCRTILSEPRPERGAVTAVACSADGRFIAWAHGMNVVTYSVASGLAINKLDPNLRAARALAFSVDGALFAVAANDSQVYLWNNSAKKPLKLPHPSVVRSLAFSPDAKFLVTGGTEKESQVCLWETETGKRIRTFHGHAKTVSAVAFSDDGQNIFSAGQDKVIRWNREQDTPIAEYRSQSPFGVTSFVPTARSALGITNQHPLLLYDLDKDSEVRRYPTRPGLSVYSSACSANGKVAAVGFERLAQVFDVETGRELATFSEHKDWVWSMALPADGRFIVTGSKDGSVLLHERDFVPLLNGKDLTNWQSFLKTGVEDDGSVFSVSDGVLKITGQPHGYLYTKQSYRNYIIRLDWRYERPKSLINDRAFQGDSGLLMHITGAPKVWPESVQVQWYHQEYGLTYLVPHVPMMNYTWNQPAVIKAMRRVGEWNRTEVLSQDGRITCILNGVEVCVGNGKLLSGQIGLQSEGALLQFKRIDIKQLP